MMMLARKSKSLLICGRLNRVNMLVELWLTKRGRNQICGVRKYVESEKKEFQEWCNERGQQIARIRKTFVIGMEEEF